MRLFVSGSAPLPAQVLEDFRERFGHTILERYGMTETMMNISNPYVGERRPGSVGFALPGISARILDAEGREVADGETGEIYLKGPNVFAGYWRREDATKAAFLDGWFKTGDIAQRAPDGYYHVVRPPQRPDHFRRLQHLSARNRRVPDGAARRCRSRRGRRRGPSARRDPSGVRRGSRWHRSIAPHSKRCAAKSWRRSSVRAVS